MLSHIHTQKSRAYHTHSNLHRDTHHRQYTTATHTCLHTQNTLCIHISNIYKQYTHTYTMPHTRVHSHWRSRVWPSLKTTKELMYGQVSVLCWEETFLKDTCLRMCLCMTFNSSSKALKSLSFYCYICQPRTGGLRQRFNLNMTTHMRTLAQVAISK